MLKMILLALTVASTALPASIFACGVDMSSSQHENSNGRGNKGSLSRKKIQSANLKKGIALTDQAAVKDDRWEKVKARLNQTRANSGN